MSGTKDLIIELFENNPNALRLLGRAWDIFYFEGRSPDVGKRRENFVIQMLRKEFGLSVQQAPDTEREWDFKVIQDDGSEKYYNLKTTEGYSNVKLAWDGFPDRGRILNFEFHYDILYIVGDRKNHTIELSVITIDDLRAIQEAVRNDPSKLEEYWWVPKRETNPRGFGLKASTIRMLVGRAREKGNYIKYRYDPIPPTRLPQLRMEYFEGWYELIKKIALER